MEPKHSVSRAIISNSCLRHTACGNSRILSPSGIPVLEFPELRCTFDLPEMFCPDVGKAVISGVECLGD